MVLELDTKQIPQKTFPYAMDDYGNSASASSTAPDATFCLSAPSKAHHS